MEGYFSYINTTDIVNYMCMVKSALLNFTKNNKRYKTCYKVGEDMTLITKTKKTQTGKGKTTTTHGSLVNNGRFRHSYLRESDYIHSEKYNNNHKRNAAYPGEFFARNWC